MTYTESAIEDVIFSDVDDESDGNFRVIYLKDTYRHGWIGTVYKVTGKYLWVMFDNDTDQRYSMTAAEWLHEDGYLMKLEDYNRGKKLGMEMTEFEEAPRPTLKTAEYLVVVKTSGKVIPFFNEADAENFCAEQITTSHNMQSFSIFKYDFEMATKAPEVVKSVRSITNATND